MKFNSDTSALQSCIWLPLMYTGKKSNGSSIGFSFQTLLRHMQATLRLVLLQPQCDNNYIQPALSHLGHLTSVSRCRHTHTEEARPAKNLSPYVAGFLGHSPYHPVVVMKMWDLLQKRLLKNYSTLNFSVIFLPRKRKCKYFSIIPDQSTFNRIRLKINSRCV